jgi:hypothetical protein
VYEDVLEAIVEGDVVNKINSAIREVVAAKSVASSPTPSATFVFDSKVQNDQYRHLDFCCAHQAVGLEEHKTMPGDAI